MFKKLLSWYDNNILPLLAAFLLIFIPLYPKLPLFDIIPGYIVRVRLEDFFVFFAAGIFFLQFLRRKVKLVWGPVTLGLLAYLAFGLISVVVSIYVINTVPREFIHMEKTFLNWLRRLEYFSLFFVAFAAVKSTRTVKIFIVIFFFVLAAVTLYGFGQKYLYWPAYSTMNREFSKGWPLILTEHARVLSTFGGHYDLAGYLVMALTLAWSFFFAQKNLWLKSLLGLSLAGGFWLLILTASRASFAGYLIGLTVVVFLWAYKKGVGWGISRYFVALSLSLLIMISFGDLSDRFLRVFRLNERIDRIKNVLLKPATSPPKQNVVYLENNLSAVASKSDTPPTPIKPPDVSGKEAPLMIAQKTASGSTILVERPRTYSQNAMMFDLSTGIRFDASWPRAIEGFQASPLTGSGYATLTKTYREEFTEAESTDNDYLRALGETGLLGFLTFFGVLVAMMVLSFRSLGGLLKDSFSFALVSGFIGFVAGLLVNAVAIDIFEASKVAYVFWGLSGLVMGLLYVSREKILSTKTPLKLEFTWAVWRANFWRILASDKLWLLVLAVLAFSLRTTKLDAPLADWHSWRQADTAAVTRNFTKDGFVNWLYPRFDDLSSIPSGIPNPTGLRYVEFPFYNALSAYVHQLLPELNNDNASRLTTDALFCLGLIFLFLLSKRYFGRRPAYLIALTYALLPYNIYYGRVILPDPTMVSLSLGALYFTSSYFVKSRLPLLLIGVLLSALALLVKPFAVFLLFPLLYLAWQHFPGQFRRLFLIGGALALALVPLFLWRSWISHHPEAIPASDWLYNGDGIRFKGAFWYWLFADRIARLILGYWGVVLLVLGLIRRPLPGSRFGHLALVMFLGALGYLAIFATGNVRHDYYQILITPSLAMLVGLGLDYLFFSVGSNLNPWLAKIVALVCFLFMLAFGWYFVKDYFNINHPEIVAAGRRVDELTPSHAKVIAPYGGDTAFLYQTNRQGWPIVEGSVEALIAKGADYYVSTNLDDLTKNLLKQSLTKEQELKNPYHRNIYRTVDQTASYVIIQLVPDKFLPKD